MEQKELLQKLRATPACELCAQAANEIERLQAAWDAAFRQAVSNGEEIQWLRAGMRDMRGDEYIATVSGSGYARVCEILPKPPLGVAWKAGCSTWPPR